MTSLFYTQFFYFCFLFSGYLIIFSDQMLEDKRIYVGVVAGFAALYLMKRYFAGGQCIIQKDLSSDIAVITGGNTGIGKETARRLSELGCKVIIGARDTNKSQLFVQQMAKSKGKVIAFKLDLADKASIQDFALKVKDTIGDQPLNYLINNAGVMAIPQKRVTKQGFQMQIGVNHFGHFYLTYLLWDRLKKAPHPRIINVSSRAHETRGADHDIDFQNLHFNKGGYSAFAAYSRSKKSNILFTKQLQRRMDEAKINGLTLSLHPGVVRTELAREMLNSFWKKALYSILTPFTYIFMKSSKEGAQTTIFGVLERQQKIEGGQYYADCHKTKLLAKQCQSDQVAKKLWEVTEQSFGIKFNV